MTADMQRPVPTEAKKTRNFAIHLAYTCAFGMPLRCARKLYQSCAPPPRRRRRRPNIGVAPAPSSWRVHDTLCTSYVLPDFCNAVNNEAWTLTKNSKNNAGVFCNSPWYSNETRGVKAKVFSWFVKMKADAKSFVWNFFGNLANKADGRVKYFNSVYCNNCL